VTMSLQQLADKIEIQELLSKYARAVDTNDWEAWRSVFTEDAVIDYTPLGGIAGTRDEVGEYMSSTMPLLPMKQHYITNIESEVRGDTADVLAMFYNPMRLPGCDDFSYCGGWYRHQLVRTESGWRSVGLREENTWFVNPAAAAESAR
jgi:ketosteroid isomerase-like protein